MLNHNAAIAVMREAVKAKRPFMFARYGDGEGIVLGYPEHTSQEAYKKRLNKWFVAKDMTEWELRYFAEQVRESVSYCDLVGMPERRHGAMGSNWTNVKRYIGEHNLLHAGQQLCGMDAVLWLQRCRHVPKLIRGIDRLCCITCRDVKQELLRVCHGLTEIEFFYIPPQVRPLKGSDMSGGRAHYPELFSLMPRWLDKMCATPGQVFFIGAGGAGKIYAKMVKERGGVALDMGSLFDGWAGLVTRSHIKDEPQTWRL